jgi:hypothetical protein
MGKMQKWLLGVVLQIALIIGSTAFLMWAVPKIMNNMGNEILKNLEETKKQNIQNMKNAQKAPPPIPGQPAPPSNDWVFVKGRTLKECAPTNYINETVLRCTKDHYEPPQHGNH